MFFNFSVCNEFSWFLVGGEGVGGMCDLATGFGDHDADAGI